MRHSHKTIKIALIIIVVSFLCFQGFFENESSNFSFESLKKREKLLKISLESLHRLKTTPKQKEWLTSVKESGQTFEQYVKSKPNRIGKNKSKIYLRTIGSFNDKERSILLLASEYLSKFYSTPTIFLDSISVKMIPSNSIRNHQNKKQLSAKYVLNELLNSSIPTDAAAYLAFTKMDLYSNPKNNFVFGLASLKNKVGVCSLARFGDTGTTSEAYNECLIRTLKVASHELGHIFGIKHCISYSCIMNGSNSMFESDLKPVYLCPKDLMKISWNRKLKEQDRFKELQLFWNQHHFTENETFYRKCLEYVPSY